MKQHQISKLSAQTTAQQTDSEVVFAPEEDCEPDSPECRSANAFLEALARGDAPAVARGLRKMKQLDGVALEILADHFEGKPTPELIYPFILKFVRRRRGKPGHITIVYRSKTTRNRLGEPRRYELVADLRGPRRDEM
jgi:hypothetical protein